MKIKFILTPVKTLTFSSELTPVPRIGETVIDKYEEYIVKNVAHYISENFIEVHCEKL